MKTITIQIGNTDNRLTQQEWSEFIYIMGLTINNVRTVKNIIHFAGGSASDAPWQNYCWVLELETESGIIENLKREVSNTGKIWNQDSIAWTEGETQFI